MEIRIHEAEPRDIAEMAVIMSTTEAWTCFGIDYNYAFKTLTTMPDALYVATSPATGEVVGFGSLRREGVGNFGAYTRLFAVKEKYRERGVGRQLLDFIWDIATKTSPNLFLICSENNAGGLKFYDKMGFARVGVLPDLVIDGHNEILLRKTTGPLLG